MRLQTLMPSREPKDPHSVEDLENRGMMIKGELLHSTVTGVPIPWQGQPTAHPEGYLQIPHPTVVSRIYLVINPLKNILISTGFMGWHQAEEEGGMWPMALSWILGKASLDFE